MTARFLAFIPFLLLFASGARAQLQPENNSRKLARELSEFRAKIANATRALDAKYAAHLAKLEQTAAQEGRYQEAKDMRARRLSLQTGNALFAPDFGAKPGTILLLPADARVTGKAQYDAASRMLTGFKSVGSTAEWRVIKCEPGQYRVRILHATGGFETDPETGRPIPTGGSFRFFEDTRLSVAKANSITEAARSTGGWQQFVLSDIGEFHLERTSATFRIELTTAEAGGVMNIRGIELVPVSAAESGRKEPASLVNLKTAHQAQLNQISKPVFEAHLKKLTELESEAVAEKNLVLLEQVRKEILHTKRLASGEAVADTTGDVEGGASAVPPPADGLERQAVLSLDDLVSGTSFTGVVRGEKIPMKLYLVESPGLGGGLAEGKDPSVEAFENYFELGEAELDKLGEISARHTEQFLGMGPFFIRSWGETDKDGRLFVQVRVPRVGDYGRVLLLKGLAARVASLYPAVVPPAPPQARLLSESYTDAEKSARETKQGAWSLLSSESVAF